MDEQRLSDLFAAAARQAPPAGFDESDVRAESARITTRNRRRLAGGALAIVVLAGVGTGIGVVSSSSDDGGGGDSAASYAGEGAADAAAPGLLKDLPAAPPAIAEQAPTERASTPCPVIDPSLATRLLAELAARGITGSSDATCIDGFGAVVVQVPGGALTLTAGQVDGGLTGTRDDGSMITLSTTGPLEADLRQIVDALSH